MTRQFVPSVNVEDGVVNFDVLDFELNKWSGEALQVYLWGWVGESHEKEKQINLLKDAYRKHGERSFDSHRGEFAFVFIDRFKRIIFLVRDPLGTRGLFYSFAANHLYCSSYFSLLLLKMKKVKIEKGVLPLSFNPRPLWQVLYNKFPQLTDTYVHEIKSVRPGHFLKISESEQKSQRYFEVRDWPPNEKASDQELAEELEHLFRRSIARRQRGDQPIGLFLSGGLDSSVIAVLLNEIMGEKSANLMHSFSLLGFDKENPEVEQLEAVLEQGSWQKHFDDYAHHKIEEFHLPLDGWPAFNQNFSSSEILNYSMARARALGISTALFGWGGDDIFCINGRVILESGGHQGLIQKLREYQYWNVDHGIVATLGFLTRDTVKGLISNSVLKKHYTRQMISLGLFSEAVLRDRLAVAKNYNFIQSEVMAERLMVLDSCGRDFINFQEYGLRFGINFSFPFFDTEIIEFMQRVPKRWYKNLPNDKLVLRLMAKNILPDVVSQHRSKMNFNEVVMSSFQSQASDMLDRCEEFLHRMTEQGSSLFEGGGMDDIESTHFRRLEKAVSDLRVRGLSGLSTVDLMGSLIQASAILNFISSSTDNPVSYCLPENHGSRASL